MQYSFSVLQDAQQKTYLDSTQLYQLYLDKLSHFNQAFRYRFGFQKKGNKEYVFKENLNTLQRKYLNNTPETISLMDSFNAKKVEQKKSIKSIKRELEIREKYNKFEKIGHTPSFIVEILAKINELGLDHKMVIIGTNALYAYEMLFGVTIEQKHLATVDIDILNRRNVRLPIAVFNEGSPSSVVEMLKSIDETFEENPKAPYQFINKNHVIVELINPASKDFSFEQSRKDLFFEMVQKIDIKNIEWLISSRLIQSIVVAQNGKMAKMTTIHPVDFMVYKFWLSKQRDRNPIKAQRDFTQSMLVTQLLLQHSHFDVSKEVDSLQHIQKEAVDAYKQEILVLVT
jgi:hypothetical protein